MTELAWVDDELGGFELATLTYPAWHARAACRDVSRSVFFPRRNGEDASELRAVCARCCVARECLRFALSLSHGDDFGVWGGTTRAERALLRREIAHRTKSLLNRSRRPSDTFRAHPSGWVRARWFSC